MAGLQKNIAVLGAGQIGAVIAGMLAAQGHRVTLADASRARLASNAGPAIPTRVVDAADHDALRVFLAGQDIVVSACPYFLNNGIARVAVETGTHYFDLTEDVATTAYIREIAASAEVALVPQCGLAPGFICVLGADMAARFETVKTIKMRVGALPLYPTNALRYNVTWSVDGLINEYCNPCEIILDGRPVLVPPLEGVDSVMIDGVAYEAFNTSGGLGTLTETLAGKVRDMSYKTLRYPGHAEIMKLLLQGLELAGDRDTMRRILDRAAPFTRRDVVVIFVTGVGERNGRTEEDSIVLRYDGRPELGAIQLTTAAGCVAMVELFLLGKLPDRGFVRQEDASLSDFLSTRAGSRLVKEARSSETSDLVGLASKRAAA
ncbi:saccharopine dehydrogenase NADP-binding domain-containing protein [Bradyrhizobium jicamae]|uniref:Saccharopine dehydrogenase NADP-binding domain-containing protein n=1 Tax=Bradyrhizobium jicamae TaxID=280332 RepID=A0ABS5FG45_9BRAD|nr:saccharopine dehydrogenase C-terminal domain-containing protein [Bradyrhizobium jicamae]MBR0795346.1 saccharopine dehydrogenase NADP-binding domain-containing protein [Bradyrhizobium jicamae]